MFVRYATVSGAEIDTLGWGIPYRDAVMGDWIGLYTGTITQVSQLSAYADRQTCTIEGATGTWEVYDNDAHPNYPGQVKVLRKLCTDGVSYQYMLIGFNTPETTSQLSFTIGYSAGWDSTNKVPTSVMRYTHGYTQEQGSSFTSIHTPFDIGTSTSSDYSGSSGHNYLNPSFEYSLFTAPVLWSILDTPALSCFWPLNTTGNYLTYSNEAYNIGIIAEHDNSHAWVNSTTGVTPIVFGGSLSTSSSAVAYSPYTRNKLNMLVEPNSTRLTSLVSGGTGFSSPGVGLVGNYLSANLDESIPVLPIDVLHNTDTYGHLCYVGRFKELFVTRSDLHVGERFLLETNPYVVIPAGAYSHNPDSYSGNYKLCARVQ